MLSYRLIYDIISPCGNFVVSPIFIIFILKELSMQLTREQAAEHLLKSYSVHYDIHRDIEGVSLPLLARCEYHEYRKNMS